MFYEVGKLVSPTTLTSSCLVPLGPRLPPPQREPQDSQREKAVSASTTTPATVKLRVYMTHSDMKLPLLFGTVLEIVH